MKEPEHITTHNDPALPGGFFIAEDVRMAFAPSLN
jgi:hypothetical protein